MKGMNNPIVKQAIIDGKLEHKIFSEEMTRAGFVTNKAIPGTRLRPDAISFQNKLIIELKPNNPKSIALGLKQLDKYKTALETKSGEGWMTKIVTYTKKSVCKATGKAKC